jgi:hypothetical protein
MCTELLLAILYFFTIFCVNFFLFKVLKNYFENLLYLQKIKKILTSFSSKKELNLITLLHLFSKKDLKTRNNLKKLNSLFEIQDPLIIGNIYRNLLQNKGNTTVNRISENFYFQLLENQYLSRNINLK